MSNGLPGETVRCIYQDKEGFIWMGIESVGLCRFNGIRFDIFGHITTDSTSLSSDFAEVMEEDIYGNLWIGTDFGLNKLNKDLLSISQGKKFTRFFHIENDPESLAGNIVYSLLRDSKGVLWIGTNSGLSILNSKSNTFHSFHFKINNFNKTKVQVNALFEDQRNYLWIGTNNGLFLLSPERKLISHWEKASSQLNNDYINTICDDEHGRIWLGTQSGINVFNPASQTFNHLKFKGRASYMHYAGINKIKKTNDEKLWIGSFSNGLIIYDIDKNTYQYLSSQDKNPEGISSNQIRDFLQDRNGTVWIATKNKGLYTFDKKIETFEYITEVSEKGLGLSDKQVLAIYEDKKGFLWIGTRFGGLNKYDPVRKKFTYFQYHPNTSCGITSNRIESIIEDQEGLIWLATVDGLFKFDQNRFTHFEFVPIKVIQEDTNGQLWLGTKTGVYRFDKKRAVYIPLSKKSSQFPLDKFVTALLIDSYGKIWIGTYNFGLMEYDPATEEIIWYQNSGKPGSLGNNMVRSIYEDAEKRIWVGSKQEGFDLFDRKTKTFQKFNSNNGLPSNSVFSITGDNSGNLWLATNKGISKFNPATKTFTNFSQEYGLQGDIFISGAVFKAKDGKLYFGGDNGLNSFYPEKINLVNIVAPIVITGVKRNENYINPKNIENTILSFAYDDYISFEFALLNYNSPQKNRYAYKLNGLNDDWIYSESRNYVSYINLPAGKYSFEVKGANADGQWSLTPALISFEVNPPWWVSWQAVSLYAVITLLIVYFAYKMLRFKAKKKQEVQTLKLEKDQSEMLSNFKIRFFTNISHEIRTPLTLILPSVEKLNTLKGLPAEAGDHLFILKKNTNKLLNLVDELLEFRKIEQGQLSLKCIKADIIAFISEITSMFKDAVYLKNIEFLIDSEHKHFEMIFDPGAIEKILSNLLSNAYKFTGENGRIELSISSVYVNPENKQKMNVNDDIDSEYIEIKVQDNGKGIPQELLSHIFEPYFRVESYDVTNYNGIGIGLDLTKSLVQLHHGYIYAESTENIGSTFKILLPVDEKFYTRNELIKSPFNSEKYIIGFNSALFSKIAEPKTNIIQSGIPIKKDFSILVVEDDPEILNLLNNILSEDYQVWIANDGENGLKIAQENLPDLILSDVVMPGLDGTGLCKKIKAEFKTSHIPVILLSANAGIEHKIEGFESGADSYIPKPFHIKQLKVEIENLIKSRQKLKELFRKNIYLQPGELNIPSVDEKFVTRCLEILDKHLTEPEFGVVELSQEMGLSRTQLFRKLKALLGQTPLEFINSTRLKKAAKLLIEKQYTVSEVAYMTGFSNPSSFSTSFRRFFGKAPSDYITSNEKVIHK
jgi:ligand-binding sensor domain-containing protein/DNA-binding response OmpR family regulator